MFNDQFQPSKLFFLAVFTYIQIEQFLAPALQKFHCEAATRYAVCFFLHSMSVAIVEY